MPTVTIPFALPATARGWAKSIGTSAKDQQLINGVYETDGQSVYCTKRAGSSTSTTIASGVIMLTHYSTLFATQFCSTATNFYTTAGTNLGTLEAAVAVRNNYVLADSQVSSVGILAWVTGGGGGYYLYSDAITTNFPTFSGDTHTNTVIDGIASTTGLYPGQLITGTGIQAGTRIATITSATAITVTLATTGTATVTITKEAIAKVIDSNFPTTANAVVAMNGRFFWSAGGGRIYQSDLNNPSAYTGGEFITADYSGDSLQALSKVGEYIAALGTLNTIQYFAYGQNSTGSVLVKRNVVTGFQCPSGGIYDFNGDLYAVLLPSAPSTGVGQKGLYKFDGLKPVRISNDIWSSIINSMSTTIIGQMNVGDKSFLCIFSGAADPFIVYDPSVNDFFTFSLSAAMTSSNGPMFTKTGITTLFSWATGNTWQDSSVAFTMTCQTKRHILNNGMGFTINWIDLVADNESTGTATLDISRDDYESWETLGTFDMTKMKKRINAGGFVDAMCAFRLTHAANTNCRASHLIVNQTPATV